MIKTVLVTGGLGYIGGRLASALHQSGYVVSIGTRSLGLPRLDWLADIRMKHFDWDSDASLKQACHEVDCVIHLAAMNEVDCASDPLGAMKINGLGTLRPLDVAVTAGVKRFIYLNCFSSRFL